MKKKGIIAGVLVLVFAFFIIGIIYLSGKKEEQLKLAPQALTSDNLNVALDENGVPTYITGDITETKVIDEKTALEAIETVKDVLLISGDVEDEFYLLECNNVGDIIYYELQQKYSGYDVYGAELTLSVDKEGNVLGINGSYIPGIYVSTYSLLKEDEIKTKLSSVYGSDVTYHTFEKYVYVDAKDDEYMIYSVILSNSSGVYEVFVNAKNGNVLEEYDLYNENSIEFKGTGLNDVEYTVNLNEVKNITGGVSYEFYDEERNIIVDTAIGDISFFSDGATKVKKYKQLNNDLTKIIFSNFSPISFTVIDDTLYYDGSSEGLSKDLLQNSFTVLNSYGEIYDYYYNVLGRKSYDNKGGKIKIKIMTGTSDLSYKYNNASWISHFDKMIIGFDSNGNSYVLSKDVLAHEFTHGVVSYTSKFKDAKDVTEGNESGALNEGYADVLGSLVEGKNWTMAENNEVLRNLADPESLGAPSEKGGDNYFPTDSKLFNSDWQNEILKEYEELGVLLNSWKEWDDGGEHQNSTVVSHAAYLMYANGAFKDREEMAKVWYNSLFLLSSYSNFKDAAYAVIQAAVNLGLSVEKVEIIKDAFYETKMLADEYHDLSGVVTDDNDKLLEGVLVTAVNKLNGHVKFEVYSDKDGKYLFSNLPEGSYDLIFDKAKYNPLEKEVELTGDKKEFNVSLEMIEEDDYEDSQVVFVMDISASMYDSDPTDARKRIIVNILSSMDSRDDVALVIFAKNATTVNDGLSDKAINKKILMTDVYNITNNSGYGDNAGTNGKAGLKKAIGLFDKDTEKRKYIVFLTDGQDNVSDSITYDELIEKAKKKDIRILTVGLGKDVDSDDLKKIASGTNGKYYYADSSTDLYAFDYKIFSELE